MREPRSQLDRPYTLPKGVDAWGTGASVRVGVDDAGSAAAYRIPLPTWYLSLSDDWGLTLGSGIGAAHQFFDDGQQRLGATLSMPVGFGSDGGRGDRADRAAHGHVRRVGAGFGVVNFW